MAQLPQSQWPSQGHFEEDLDFVPDPVYFNLEHLLPSLREAGYSSDSSTSSSIGGSSDIELNLFAPPPDSWYHGMISRQQAQSRMEANGKYGCYLIRDSETRPGEYTLSFMSNTCIVHHFKINASCGDYYIGGRQFDSLEDLIGFYTNCSCILEDECLAFPVAPPLYVPLYHLLRASTNHVKNPNSDELSIAVNEVFVLKNRLSDDWGWATSQLSGDSGLIPLNIMEECPSSEPFYGKPWFFGAVVREEAIQRLEEYGQLGSFLVRLSQGRGLGGRMYSLAVLTSEGVQRFLIERDNFCYYSFGGREFSSIDQIIERYAKEDIVAGQRLKNPLPRKLTSPARQVLPRAAEQLQEEAVPIRPRIDSSINISRGDNPRDKKGYLVVKKGKKGFVRWKKQYCVLTWEDQHFIIYENDQSHRSKGLLDLNQCCIINVHPSIKPGCFVVVQRYLMEQVYYYLQSDAEDTIREWQSAMRSACSSMEQQVTLGSEAVQELWSLDLHMKDCRLASRSATQHYCTVAIDDVPVACTKKTSQTLSTFNFDEKFKFADLPGNVQSLALSVSTKTKIKDTFIGKVVLNFQDLPNCQEHDKWHQLSSGKTKGSTLRVAAVFSHEVILPPKEYSSLKELILQEDLVMLETLAKVCRDHHAELASRLVQIFLETDYLIDKLIQYNQRVIDNEVHMGTLFRSSSLATMLMDQYMKLKCVEYLHHVMKNLVCEVQQCAESCELDPTLMDKEDHLDRNLNKLKSFIDSTVERIFNSSLHCPRPLRYVFYCLQKDVCKKWPQSEVCKTRTVGGFLFLRLICPALLKPQLFDLTNDILSPVAERTLKLVAKYLQNLANQVEFKAKEQYMVVLNTHLTENMVKMKKFIENLSNVSSRPEPPKYISYEPGRDLAFVYRICLKYEDEMKKISSSKEEIASLLKVMQQINQAEKRYLRKTL